jgi:hypothetical protein
MYLFEGSGVRSATVIAANDVRVEVFFEEEIQAELAHASQELRQMLSSFTYRLRNTTCDFVSLFKEKMIVELPDGTMKVVDSR